MTHPLKHRSSRLTDGPDRAPARAMMKAVGFGNDDLARPLVGVAHEASVPLLLDDFDYISTRTLFLADFKPTGRFIISIP